MARNLVTQRPTPRCSRQTTPTTYGRLTLTQHLVAASGPTQTITYYTTPAWNGYQETFQNLPPRCSIQAGRLAAVQFVTRTRNVRQNGV